ncbi:NAD(P)H:quinone oxidoreductase [Indiicoccus explosivorum]|uniref:NAD(P)H:quinone oxidoreductase n=1 Tax=Indiicoccus explosivorum TaxID=1917864 RepID=UPI000B43F8FC|nr:NAD(P)H:quinone oxidoreductase [Indiicoccus explosivorum]
MGILSKLFGGKKKTEQETQPIKQPQQVEEPPKKVKVAVVYYSMSGTNYQLAQWAAEGAREAGAEATVFKATELAPQEVIDTVPAWQAHLQATEQVPAAQVDDLVEADAIIFSVPTRFGNMAAQLQQLFDTAGGAWAQGKLANKVVSAMASAQNPHGGQEATILGIYKSMHHWGTIIAAPGYTDPVTFAAGGNPYGTSVSVDQEGNMIEDRAAIEAAVKHQAKRTVMVAGWVKNR